MKLFRFKLQGWVKNTLSFLVLFGLLSFVGYRYEAQTCQKVQIFIDTSEGNKFISQEEVQVLLDNNGKDYLIGSRYRNINTKVLEERIKTNKYVQTCQISKNLKGELIVQIWQFCPVARVLVGNQNYYLDKKGTIAPTSKDFTAYCLVLTSDKNIAFNFLENSEHKELLEVLKQIWQSSFWRSQIAQIHILQNNELKMYLQVGNITVEWGKLEKSAVKFAKLKTFCGQILPTKGWNTYKKVSLKYHHQIVCE